jgi:hypothetical protein
MWRPRAETGIDRGSEQMIANPKDPTAGSGGQDVVEHDPRHAGRGVRPAWPAHAALPAAPFRRAAGTRA